MNIIELTAFLTIVEEGNISKAAQKLFVSQSTLSQRLIRLEEKLNMNLIFRSRGGTNIQLSPKGKKLVPLAQNIINTYDDIHRLNNKKIKLPLVIAATAIINEGTFLSLYDDLIENNPNIHLTIKTFHSGEIYRLISNNHADIGFVYDQIQYPNIVTTPIFSDHMFLVTKTENKYYENISIKDLNPEKEIFLDWGNKYKNWHDRKIDANKSILRVDTGTSMIKNLNKKGTWGIAPGSLINSYKESEKLFSYNLLETPPERIVYQLLSRHITSNREDTVKIFQRKMERFILSNESITNLFNI